MKSELKAFGFALCISVGFLLVFIGNVLIVGGILGDEIIWKEIVVGFVLLFIGLFSAIFAFNVSHMTGGTK